jgi:hypothetical protein
MNAGMVRRIIVVTWIILVPLNMVVSWNYWSSDYMYDWRWLRYPFIIVPILALKVSSHIAKMILNLQLGCHYMLPKCLKLLRTTFGPNWTWGTWWSKYTTNIKWFGGHGSTWGSPWWKMISFDKMRSPISIESTRKKVSSCMPTPQSWFKHGHIVIRMMCVFWGSDKYWWDSSAIHHRDPNICPIQINAHMGAQRNNLNGCNFWH